MSETWFKPSNYVKFQNYNLVREDRRDGKSGVAILLKKQINYRIISDLPTLPTVMFNAISLEVSNSLRLTLVSIYVLPRTKISLQQWSNFFSSIPKPFIIGGDFNRHHLAWGCSLSSCFGTTLLEAINDNNLIFLNDGSTTLLKNVNSVNDSAIDLTICTSDLAGALTWEVLDDPCGSNHLPILMTSPLSTKYIGRPRQKKWNIKKANWTTYYNACQLFPSDPSQCSYHEFIKKIECASEEAIPKFTPSQTKPHQQHKPKSWWNDQCQKAADLRKSLYKLYCQKPTLDNLVKFKNQDAVAKKLFKSVKHNSWKEYCSTLNSSAPMSLVWKKLTKYKKGRLSEYHLISDKEEWVQEFHKKICPDWTCNIISNPDFPDSYPNPLLKPFDENELNIVLKSRLNTAPGKDDIHYKMLSELPRQLKLELLHIFNSIWSCEAPTPSEWFEYIVIPIKKPGKPRNSCNSYRPIALSSCVFKTYERLIKVRLEIWLERNKKLSCTQFGFRKGKSLYEAVGHLVTDITGAFSRNSTITSLFLDVQGAYDNVRLDILAQKMLKIGLPPRFVNNILTNYIDRRIYIKTSSALLPPRYASVGLPQGSTLSPLLYLIYTYDLDACIRKGVKLLQFADDICIYKETKSHGQLDTALSLSLEKISGYLFRNGLSMATEKSLACIFSRRRLALPDHLVLVPHRIPCKLFVRYLGIYLDTKLNWKIHIEHIVQKGEKAINILRAFCGTKWGADPNVTLLFYKNLVRSVLDFGSIFYGSASATNLNKVNVLKNKCIRLCIGYLKSTPIQVLHAEACDPPLHLRHKFLTERFILKLHAYDNSLLLKIHNLAMDTLHKKYWLKKSLPLFITSYLYILEFKDMIHYSELLPCFQLDYESLSTPIKTYRLQNYNIAAVKNINPIFNYEVANLWPSFQYIFTDGSKTRDKVGCAFFHQNLDYSESITLPCEASIFSAELLAIKFALIYCLDNPNQEFVIFSDSKSSVAAVTSPATIFKSSANYIISDIKKIYNQLVGVNKIVIIVWLKSHCGIAGNEMVDSLARQAPVEEQSHINIKIPYTDLISKLKEKLKDFLESRIYQFNHRHQIQRHPNEYPQKAMVSEYM